MLTFSVDELSSHVSVVNIKTKAPRINFYFHPVSVARVSEILSNLNVRKPAGPNGIPLKLLEIAAPVIAGPMTKLFNYCIDVGEWPSCFVFFSLSSVFNMSLWLGGLCKHFPRLRH